MSRKLKLRLYSRYAIPEEASLFSFEHHAVPISPTKDVS